MAVHPGTHLRANAPGGSVPIPRRTRERMAGAIFQGATRVAGLHPSLIPDHLRRQMHIIGMGNAQMKRVFPRLKRLGDWPYLWEEEGDRCAAHEDWHGAFVAWYVAQRILLTASPLKSRLYRLAVEAYARIEQPRLERFAVTTPSGEQVAGYLQLPERPATGSAPGERPHCILMVPGVTGTKEELHAYCMPLLRRGLAVARIDSPGYGETTGVLDHTSTTNARHVLEHLQRDPRLDPARIHLHGMSLGAFFALHSAAGSQAASVTVICPPYMPTRYFSELPTMNLTAVQHMTKLPDLDALKDFAHELTLEQVAPTITMPVRIFHGGRDRTIPVRDGIDLEAALGGPTALTIYERDHHNCLEHTDEMTALTLEFVHDPHGVCAGHRRAELLDVPAEAVLPEDAGAVLTPRRAWIRLPFGLPGLLGSRRRGEAPQATG